MFLGVVRGWCVGMTTLPPSMSQLFKQCAIFNILKPYRHQRPATGIALPFIREVCGSHSGHYEGFSILVYNAV
jgi:hypothetical protein